MKTLVGAAVLLAALAACGEPVGVGPAASGPTGVYVSQSGRDLVPGTHVRLDFTEDGRLLASAGCNTLGGQVDTGGGKVAVRDMSSTEMGCDQPRHAQDEWLAGFLEAAPGWRIDGERLVLTGQGAELVLGREQAPPLLGTTWVVDTLLEGETASSVPVEATLRFEAETVSIDTGCNTGSAGYRVSGDSIVFDQPGMTKMACKPDATGVEETIVSVLNGKAQLSTDGRTMTLTRDGKGIRLMAR